ncbi:unnamed protein product [Menidia menidia]|uniref:tRNA:m(4)X modification enzyme TRM13 n=1 Tax=Menidia menidia TaxID=238744 RepID=A0A8S4ABG4_9TELE|nr:unnamed protein product [Menidia menidia]
MAAPLPGRCGFFVEKKKRFCKMIVGKGKRFCGEHATMEQFWPPADPVLKAGQSACREDGGGSRRIVCPLDPKHTVTEDKLDKHLKKCNSRQRPRPVYFVENINSRAAEGEQAPPQLSLCERSRSELESLVAKLKTAVEGLQFDVDDGVLSHAVLQEQLSDPKNGDSAHKHLRQQSSILGHLEQLGLLGRGRCFVEFGAGRGKLSHWIHEALKADGGQGAEEELQILLVDGKHQDGSVRFERLQVDIQHLDLSKQRTAGLPDVRLQANSWLNFSRSGSPAAARRAPIGRRGETPVWSRHRPGSALSSDLVLFSQTWFCSLRPGSALSDLVPLCPQTWFCSVLRPGSSLSDLVPLCPQTLFFSLRPGSALSDLVPLCPQTWFCSLRPGSSLSDLVLLSQTWFLSVLRPGSVLSSDLALRCLLDTPGLEPEAEPPHKRLRPSEPGQPRPAEGPDPGAGPVLGLVVALCCHHRCEWQHYVGRPFFQQRGLGAAEFHAFCRMSSWATCGLRPTNQDAPSQEPANQRPDDEDHEPVEETDTVNSFLSAAERQQVGRLCKRLIDGGRCHFLSSRGFSSSLRRYVGPEVTLENVLLTAVPVPGPPPKADQSL